MNSLYILSGAEWYSKIDNEPNITDSKVPDLKLLDHKILERKKCNLTYGPYNFFPGFYMSPSYPVNFICVGFSFNYCFLYRLFVLKI